MNTYESRKSEKSVEEAVIGSESLNEKYGINLSISLKELIQSELEPNTSPDVRSSKSKVTRFAILGPTRTIPIKQKAKALTTRKV